MKGIQSICLMLLSFIFSTRVQAQSSSLVGNMLLTNHKEWGISYLSSNISATHIENRCWEEIINNVCSGNGKQEDQSHRASAIVTIFKGVGFRQLLCLKNRKNSRTVIMKQKIDDYTDVNKNINFHDLQEKTTLVWSKFGEQNSLLKDVEIFQKYSMLHLEPTVNLPHFLQYFQTNKHPIGSILMEISNEQEAKIFSQLLRQFKGKIKLYIELLFLLEWDWEVQEGISISKYEIKGQKLSNRIVQRGKEKQVSLEPAVYLFK